MRRSAITTFLRFAPSADFGTSSGEYGATPLEPRRRKMANGTWRQVEATFELNRRQLTRFIPHGRSQCRLPSLAAQNSMGHHASEWWRLPRRVRGRRHCRGGCCSSARAALSKKTARTIYLIDCATKLFTTRITKPVRRSRSLFVASGARTSARALGAPRARASPCTTTAAMNTKSTENPHAARRRVVVVVVLARVIVKVSTSAGVPRARDANRRFRMKRRKQQVTPNT